jgi:phosphodiesterase/alkaline phosphatase D-like protein
MAIITILILVLNNIALLLPSHAFAQNNFNNLVITDGIPSGDVTDSSAIIWSRANMQSMMHVQYDTNLSFSHAKSKTLLVDSMTDFAGQVKVDSLSPDTVYHYRVWFSPTYNKSSIDHYQCQLQDQTL